MAQKKNDSRQQLIMSQRYILNSETEFSIVEAYKTARTNLMYTRKSEGCQKIVITSTFEHEGKTSTCINLAITTAQSDKRVLIIDCDLRRSMVDRTLAIKTKSGLSELLAGIVSMSDVYSMIYETRYQNLYILPAGLVPPNPAELLASPMMKKLIETLEDKFDYIFIDSTPLCVVTDAAVLCPIVDGYIYVVRNDQTPMGGVKEGIERLERLNANILGFIYNDSDVMNSYHKYGYKRYGNKNYKSNYDTSSN